MNEKNCRSIIAVIVILAALLAISIGLNIGLGRGFANNQRLRELQRESERTIIELTEYNKHAEQRATAAERLNREAAVIVTDALGTNAATSQSLARANEILRQVIVALQSLDLLYSGGDGGGGNRLDTMGSE